MADITTGLVGWWKFDEGAGNVASDSSGNGNNGILVNSPSWVNGYFGNALSFNGSNQNITTSKLINIPKCAISAWIYILSYPINPTTLIAGFSNGGATDKNLYIDTAGHLGFYGYDGATKYASLSVNPIPLNTWTHVVGTANGTNLITYINGVQVGIVSCGNTYTGYSYPNFVIGGCTGNSYGYISAIIDEVRVYNRALLQDDITKLFNYVPLPILSTPEITNTIPSFSSLSVSWSTVLNAVGYVINLYKDSVLLETVNTTDASYLFNLLYSGNYYVSIAAVGDRITHSNSDIVNSDTVAVNGLWQGCPVLNFMGFSAIVAPPAKLNFMGFSVEKTVKLSYLNFWGFSVVDAPESFLFYQVN